MWLVCSLKKRTGHLTHVSLFTFDVKVALVKFGNMTAEILQKAGAILIEMGSFSHILGTGRTIGGGANAEKCRLKLAVPRWAKCNGAVGRERGRWRGRLVE